MKKVIIYMALILCLNAEFVDTSKPQYTTDESIIVYVEELNPNRDYWLGAYKKYSSNNWHNVISWPFSEDIFNSSIELESIDKEGEYEIRLFYKDTYELVDSVEFDIVNRKNGNDDYDYDDNDDSNEEESGQWYKASLTNYISYPEANSEECLYYNGCQWAGQFYGLDGTKSKQWVKNHNIVAVHSKDWSWLGGKKIKIRQGDHEIIATVYDICSDEDCDGCCTQNLGGNDFLIDMEKYTTERFGISFGTVQFQVID